MSRQVDAQVRDTIRLMFSEDQHDGPLEGLLHKLSSRFVSKDDLQVLLRDLELQVLKNVTHHITVTGRAPTSEAIVSAVSEAGISGITEAVSSATQHKEHKATVIAMLHLGVPSCPLVTLLKFPQAVSHTSVSRLPTAQP
jgi:hypothetical protein